MRIRKILAITLLLAAGSFAVSHKDLTTTDMHKAFRWIWADSAARAAQSITQNDTLKFGYQQDRKSIWCLADSPAVWVCVGGSHLSSDTIRTDMVSLDTDIKGLNKIETDSVTTGMLTVSGNATFSGATVANGGTVTTIDVNGGTIDGVTIGASGAPTVTNLGSVATADINGGTIDGVTIGASSAPTVTNLGSVATADINGGTIDGVTIGGASAGAGTFTTLASNTVNTGNGAVECYAMNQDVENSDAVVFATVNTGQGDNELYDMDQNVLTTSDVVFDSAYFAKAQADSFTTNGRDFFTYIDTSYVCTLFREDANIFYNAVSLDTIGTAHVEQIGNTVTCYLAGVYIEVDSTKDYSSTIKFNIPTKFRGETGSIVALPISGDKDYPAQVANANVSVSNKGVSNPACTIEIYGKYYNSNRLGYTITNLSFTYYNAP